MDLAYHISAKGTDVSEGVSRFSECRAFKTSVKDASPALLLVAPLEHPQVAVLVAKQKSLAERCRKSVDEKSRRLIQGPVLRHAPINAAPHRPAKAAKPQRAPAEPLLSAVCHSAPQPCCATKQRRRREMRRCRAEHAKPNIVLSTDQIPAMPRSARRPLRTNRPDQAVSDRRWRPVPAPATRRCGRAASRA